ncbi:hypothetical protein [Paenibacillus sp. NPDC058071]|uniref:hypothetical protein n=1 Tax=Paenibacillus sp. NPDC058071 TaxID=3346326 RepID=UPI0036DAF9BD
MAFWVIVIIGAVIVFFVLQYLIISAINDSIAGRSRQEELERAFNQLGERQGDSDRKMDEIAELLREQNKLIAELKTELIQSDRS